MKKINFLGVAAIALALTVSAFTTPVNAHAKGSGDYWFLISGSISKTSPVPQADAMFLQQSTTAPTETSCSGNTHQCVSGFTSTQVNTSTDELNGTQSPDQESQFKN
jgi:hypothetical protein